MTVSILALLAWTVLPRLVLSTIESEARKQGVELSDCDLSLALRELELHHCKLRSLKTGDIQGDIQSLKIALDGLQPISATAQGVQLKARGNLDFSTIIEQRTSKSPELIPLTVSGSSLEWFRGDKPVPWLRSQEIRYDSRTRDLSAQLELPGVLNGSLKAQGPRTNFDAQFAGAPGAQLSGSVQHDEDALEVRAEYRQLPLRMLAALAQIELPRQLAEAHAEGQLYALLPLGLTTKQTRGDFRATVKKLPLPVPKELQGLVYGNKVEVSGKFVADQRETQIQLSKLRLEAGALRLRGNAEVTRQHPGAKLESRLSGRLGCAAIVKSAALAHASTNLARVASRIAKRSLRGSVGILIAVEANTNNLNQAKILKTVTPGCGLKPQTLTDLAELPTELLEGLPNWETLRDQLKADKARGELDFKLPKLPELSFPRRLVEPPTNTESSDVPPDTTPSRSPRAK